MKERKKKKKKKKEMTYHLLFHHKWLIIFIIDTIWCVNKHKFGWSKSLQSVYIQ